MSKRSKPKPQPYPERHLLLRDHYEPADPSTRVALADAPLSAQWPNRLSGPGGTKPRIGQRWSMSVGTTRSQKSTDPFAQLEAGNPYPRSIFLRQIICWCGVSVPSVVDLWSRAWICGDIYDPPMPIWSHNWDRYGPTTMHDRFRPQDFGSGYVELVKGGWLTFRTEMAAIGPWKEWDGVPYNPANDAQFTVWFEATRPKR